MYGRYTQELGAYAKEEAARLREDGALRRSAGVRSQTPEQLEYEKDPCAKCQQQLFFSLFVKTIKKMSPDPAADGDDGWHFVTDAGYEGDYSRDFYCVIDGKPQPIRAVGAFFIPAAPTPDPHNAVLCVCQ
ncbi:hypothetical protein MHYP_G00240410 [Metynnis hypsauchen]